MPGSEDNSYDHGLSHRFQVLPTPTRRRLVVGAVGNSTAAGADRLGRPGQGRGRRCHDADVSPIGNPDGAQRQYAGGERTERQFPNLSFAPLSILRNGNGFTLSGDLPDLAAKTSLLDSLKLAFGPDIDLTDNLNIKAGVNAPDFSVLGSVLKAAVDIPDFNFDLNGDTLTLTGTAPSEDVKADVEAAAKAAWPDVKIVNNIQVQGAAPTPAPAPGGGACATLQADITGLLRTPINFQTDGFTLAPASQQQLTQVADKLKACPDPSVTVVGHTDSSGNDAINIPLSGNRAKSVADYLVSQGVAANRVTSKGVGSAEPIASNDTPDGKAQNRRVDITVS